MVLNESRAFKIEFLTSKGEEIQFYHAYVHFLCKSRSIFFKCSNFNINFIYFRIGSFFTFFHIHKKVLDSWKFSTPGFRWIHMFWDVLNTIWPFLENVCLSVLFWGHCISRTNGRKLMKLNIQLHLYGT